MAQMSEAKEDFTAMLTFPVGEVRDVMITADRIIDTGLLGYP